MISFSFLSADGKTTLAAYRTKTEKPSALVQLSHGMCEHVTRYEGFAEFLSEKGFLVFGHDHLGHGRSVESPDDLGFLAQKNGSHLLAEDVHGLALAFKREYPDLPIILLGHSMGSFVARDVLEKHPSTYSAAVIMGTAGPDMPTAAGKMLASLIGLFCGARHRSPLLRKISFAGYNKRFGKGCDENAWLSRDESVVKAYHDDPLCGFVFTASAYRDLFDLLGRISRKEWANGIKKDLPLLLISGEDDPVGGFGAGVQKIANRLTGAGVTDVTLKLYPEMRHEILNEQSYQTVWEDLFSWMQKSVR